MAETNRSLQINDMGVGFVQSADETGPELPPQYSKLSCQKITL